MLLPIELHQWFDFRIDKEHTQDAPSFHPLTKDKFINLAQDTFIKTRYLKTDLTEKNREDIESFIAESVFTPTVINDTLCEYDLSLLSPAHWYTLRMLLLQDKSCEPPYIEIKPEKHDNVFHKLQNPFKKPKPSKCFYTIKENKTIQIYKHKDTVLNNIKIWYIKQYTPCDIITNAPTDITPQIVQDVISIAVQYAIEHISSQRIQTFSAIEQNLRLQ